MINPKKSLGQNFLIDNKILEKITNLIDITNETVFEVGPGTGNLTEFILKQNPKKVIVIEKDVNLAENLKKKFEKKVIVVNDDVLKINESSFFNEKVIVYGNLPYNISTEILIKWIINLKNNFWFYNMILMFQKEVAERIIA